MGLLEGVAAGAFALGGLLAAAAERGPGSAASPGGCLGRSLTASSADFFGLCAHQKNYKDQFKHGARLSLPVLAPAGTRETYPSSA